MAATSNSLAGRARSAALGTGIAGLVGVLTPIWFTHDRMTRLRSARRVGARTPLPRVSASEVGVDELLRADRPVIVSGLTERLGIADAATPDALRRRAGGAELDVAFHDAAVPYFLYSGGYGTTRRFTRRMTVADLLDMMLGDGPDPGTVVYQLLGQRSLGGAIAEELAEFDRALAPVAGEPTAPQFSGVWIGSTGVVTPLHHDSWPGLLFQTFGRKRVAVYAPADRTNLYFRTPLRGQGRWSDLPGRSDDADPDEFPRLGRTERFEGELSAGDTLVVPPFWAHEMEAVEGNISVPFRFATRRRSYLDPGFLRPASELLRARLSQ